MAPLPPNLTDRLLIEYTSLGQAHVMEIRMPVPGDEALGAQYYAVLTDILKSALPVTDSFTGARYIQRGNTLSFSINVPPVQGTATGTPPPDNKPNFYSWVGRSGDGRRSRVTFFTPLFGETPRYRQPVNPADFTGRVYDELRGAGSLPAAVSPSGAPVIWKPYVNLGVNGYFQRKARRS